MATVLEGFTTEEQRFDVRFCGQYVSMQRKLIKKYFLLTMGSVRHKWVEILSQGSSKFADDTQKFAEVAETTVKTFLCYEFRCIGEAR
jgi:uracil-DNA glycosylase